MELEAVERAGDLPPAGLTWADYVARWVDDCGGWLPLADQLIHRAGEAVEIALDPQTVERGLRRLARRGHKPGGQYGRWMLRFFGFTSPIEQWVKWLGTYHTRFADLPCGLRLEQLALWNRPPVSESPLACWILVGIASAHYSRLDLAASDMWLGRAEDRVRAAGPAAEIEVGLLRAQLLIDRNDREAASRLVETLDARLAAVLPAEQPPYRARVQDLRALHYTRPPPGLMPDIERARELYAAIPDSPIPFVSFRKAVGLAYCAWRLGDIDEAVRLAQRAADDAGDGGLVRMRVMALNMLSRVLAGDEASVINERAHRMATALEDEDLLRRVALCAPA
jgi:hypothetical protein